MWLCNGVALEHVHFAFATVDKLLVHATVARCTTKPKPCAEELSNVLVVGSEENFTVDACWLLLSNIMSEIVNMNRGNQ